MAKLRFKDNAPGTGQFEGCWDCTFNKGASMENNDCLSCARHYRPEARQEGFPDRFTKKSPKIPDHRTKECAWT